MAFDIDKLTGYSVERIKVFAQHHPDETFYAFAIDAKMLCLNSVEKADETLREYQERWDRQNREIQSVEELTPDDLASEDFLLGLHEGTQGLDRTDLDACRQVINEDRERRRAEGCEYRTPEGIEELRRNTGDWAYQGFADLTDGFDEDAYSQHYHLPAWRQKFSAYARAMNRLLKRIQKSGVLDHLRTTPQPQGRMPDPLRRYRHAYRWLDRSGVTNRQIGRPCCASTECVSRSVHRSLLCNGRTLSRAL